MLHPLVRPRRYNPRSPGTLLEIGRAAGQSLRVIDDLDDAAEVRTPFAVLRLDRAASPFGAEQRPPPGASAVDRLAAFFGRSV